MKNTSPIEHHINLLGTEMEDIVTGGRGMVSSISFDAYGCVMAVLSPKLRKDGTKPESGWMDVKRLRPTGKATRIMDTPPHFTTAPGDEQGAASKPQFRQ